MDDKEICIKAMKDWPVEARPLFITWGPPHDAEDVAHERPQPRQRFYMNPGCTKVALVEHVHALFRDSGLHWLANDNAKDRGRVRRGPVRLWNCGHHWHLECPGFSGEHNDSPLYLINEAILTCIRATKP